MLRPLRENDRKALEKREPSLAKTSIPSVEDIKKWYETKKSLMKVTLNLVARDGQLETMMKTYFHDRFLKDDGN